MIKINLYNRRGFSLVEMLVVLALSIMLFAAGGSLFASGNATWNTGDSQVKMQENLRYALDRMASEIRSSSTVSGEGALQVIDGAGVGTTDAIKFSVPVICQTDASLMSNDAVAHWGASLTWGCKQSSCMDADDNCNTVEYKYIYYVLNANNKLERRVLDSSSVPISTKEMAAQLSDLQFSVSGSVVTINVSAQEVKQNGRTMTAQTSLDVYLRN